MIALLASCADTTKPDTLNDNEVITTVELAFSAGEEAIIARWADPENDGDPLIDPIVLSDADDYSLSVRFLNELEDPPEDITEEVEAESDEHQVFFTGSALDTVVSYTYDDQDDNGLPVGLRGLLSTLGPGDGTFTVTLRHLPPEGGVPVKPEGQAAGDVDVEVSFELEVQ